MNWMGKELVRETFEYIPAQMKLVRHWQTAYQCPHCRKNGRTVIVRAAVEKPLLNHSMISASVVSEVMYLLDGRCELSNNLAENAIRPFTVGRKNWLFCDTVRGAKASAVIYSLIETAKANDLSPKAYLHICLANLPSMDYRQHPEELLSLMPWSAYMQSCIKQEK